MHEKQPFKLFDYSYFNNINQSIKAIALLLLIVISLFWYLEHGVDTEEKIESLAVISQPQIDDIYFLDVRLMSDNVRPNQKYRIAKVVDITGEIISLIYSDYFYQQKHAVINSIKYGQLSFKRYFSPKRYDIALSDIIQMYNKGSIYLAQRPIRKKLYGNIVGPTTEKTHLNPLAYGAKENIKGEAYFNEKFSENNVKYAFEQFERSAILGYAKGQVNLAQMYINGQYVDKSFEKALYWLKQASIQSSKPAVLKYGIICKQVSTCDLVDFYKELTDIGVNIKVREIDFSMDN